MRSFPLAILSAREFPFALKQRWPVPFQWPLENPEAVIMRLIGPVRVLQPHSTVLQFVYRLGRFQDGFGWSGKCLNLRPYILDVFRVRGFQVKDILQTVWPTVLKWMGLLCAFHKSVLG